jgi:RNA polymerase sigma-70 factor (ECF subfamily)
LSDPSSEDRGVPEPQEDRSASDEDDRVRRAASGDVEAYEMLYRTHVGRVHALCLRMTRDRGEAEELTQQTFVRVWERLASFRGQSAFSSWLHRVTVNVVVDEMRSRGRWRDRLAPLDEASAIDSARSAFSGGGDLDLERAIANLSPRARLVFLLHDVEGYKHGEIAELTGLAVGTSKAHLHRARRLLREELSR